MFFNKKTSLSVFFPSLIVLLLLSGYSKLNNQSTITKDHSSNITSDNESKIIEISVNAGTEIKLKGFKNTNKLISIKEFVTITSFDNLPITKGSAIIHLPNGQTIRIENINPEDLSSSNFKFAHDPEKAPIVFDDTASVIENGNIKIDVLANDSNTGGGLVPSLFVDASHTKGKVIITNDNKIHYYTNGQFDHLANGESNTDTFKYTATSTKNKKSPPATVTVQINGL